MSTTLGPARAAALAAVCAALAISAPLAARAQVVPREVRQQSLQITIGGVAGQLGAKVTTRENDDFTVGSSFTGVLADPAKLASLGVAGLHGGARVSAMRVAPERIKVEVDELDPVPLTRKATLKIDERGTLSVTRP
jgi:hypothetical protein